MGCTPAQHLFRLRSKLSLTGDRVGRLAHDIRWFGFGFPRCEAGDVGRVEGLLPAVSSKIPGVPQTLCVCAVLAANASRTRVE